MRTGPIPRSSQFSRSLTRHARNEARAESRVVVLLDIGQRQAGRVAVLSTTRLEVSPNRGIEWYSEPLDVVVALPLEEEHALPLADDQLLDRRRIDRTHVGVDRGVCAHRVDRC